MPDKIFRKHDELIDLLIERGVDISTPKARRFAKTRLQHEEYYNLINGYKTLFLVDPTEDEYKAGTTIDEIYVMVHGNDVVL